MTTTTLDDRTTRALSRGHPIDITTTGRRSGQPRRLEIVFFNIDGRIYISGMPSRRERQWLKNLRVDPRLTFHLKGAISGDLPASAREVTDPAERRAVIEHVARAWRRTDADTMVELSPLIEVLIEGYAPATAA